MAAVFCPYSKQQQGWRRLYGVAIDLKSFLKMAASSIRDLGDRGDDLPSHRP
jgi:hypothetical protein